MADQAPQHREDPPEGDSAAKSPRAKRNVKDCLTLLSNSDILELLKGTATLKGTSHLNLSKQPKRLKKNAIMGRKASAKKQCTDESVMELDSGSSDSESPLATRVGVPGGSATREDAGKTRVKDERDQLIESLKWNNEELTRMVEEQRKTIEDMSRNMAKMQSTLAELSAKLGGPLPPPLATKQAKPTTRAAPPTKTTAASGTSAGVSTESSPTAAAATPVPKKRVPAIVTKLQDTEELSKFLKVNKMQAVISQKFKSAIITPKTAEEHTLIWERMTERKLQGHTNNPNAPTFPRKWILRGLPANFKECEIVEDIYEKIGATVKVEQMSKQKRDGAPNEREPAALFAVTAESSEMAKAMRDLAVVNYHRVTWESPKKPDIRQCFKCQGFGHSAAFCNYDRRCVKCDSQHEPGMCQNNDDKTAAHCVNCGADGHPASWRGCPKRLASIEIAQRQRERNAVEAAQRASIALPRTFDSGKSSIRPGTSFAAAAAAAANQRVIQPAAAQNAAGCLLGLNINEISSRIQHDIAAYKNKGGQIQCKSDKDSLIVSILASIQIDSMFNV